MPEKYNKQQTVLFAFSYPWQVEIGVLLLGSPRRTHCPPGWPPGRACLGLPGPRGLLLIAAWQC